MISNETEPSVIFTTNLRFLRQSRGISQLELASDLGFPVERIIRYESGITEPDHQTLLQLSQYFKVRVHAFLESDLCGKASPFIAGRPVDEGLDDYDYDNLMKSTHQAQLHLDTILNAPDFRTFIEGMENDPRQWDILRLIDILKLLLENNWQLIRKMKEYYHFSSEA